MASSPTRSSASSADVAIVTIPLTVKNGDGKQVSMTKQRVDTILRQCRGLQQQHQIEVQVATTTAGDMCTVAFHGSRDSIARAAADVSTIGHQCVFSPPQALLTQCNEQKQSVLKVPVHLAMDEHLLMQADVAAQLQQVIQRHDVEIVAHLQDASQLSPSLHDVNACGQLELTITGAHDAVHNARVQCLVFFDERRGLVAASLQVPKSTVCTQLGRHRSILSDMCAENNVLVYIESCWQDGEDSCNVWLTARDEMSLLSAKSTLEARMKFNASNLVTKVFKAMHEKCQWLKAMYREELCQIMVQTATAVVVQFDRVTVSGRLVGQVELAIKKVVDLCGKLVTATISVKKDIRAPLTDSKSRKFCEIVSAHPAMFINRGSQVVMVADAENMQSLMAAMLKLNDEKKVFGDAQLSIEMACEYQEFVSGKKDGKLIKIERTGGMQCRFEDNNNLHSTTVLVRGANFKTVLDGYSQLLNEIPAELEFRVADVHHKRIIGVGGRVIQVHMKEYGVYVKFSGANEFEALGGILDADMNVLARTPQKNKHNLNQLYLAVMDMVNPLVRDYVTQQLDMPLLQQSQLLLASSSTSLKTIEQKYGVEIRVQPFELGVEQVTLTGTAKDVSAVLQLLRDSAVHEYEFVLPATTQLTQATLLNNVQLTNFLKTSNVSVSTTKPFKFTVTSGNATVMKELHQLLSDAGIQLLSLHYIANEEIREMLAPEVVKQSVAHKAAFWQQLTTTQSLQSPPIRTATPTRQQQQQQQQHPGLLRSAIVNSAVTSALSPLAASANQFRPKMQIQTNDGNIFNMQQRQPMTAMTPNAPSRRPPGLSVQTLTPPGKQVAPPQSAPVGDDFKHGQDMMESIVRRVMHVDLGDSAAARNSKLARLLDMLELQKYKQVMQEHEVDFDMFLQLTEADMRELGIPMGPRKKMLQAIAEIRMHRALDNSVQSAVTPRHQRANTFNAFQSSWQPQHLAALSPSTQLGFVDFLPGTPLSQSFTLTQQQQQQQQVPQSPIAPIGSQRSLNHHFLDQQ